MDYFIHPIKYVDMLKKAWNNFANNRFKNLLLYIVAVVCIITIISSIVSIGISFQKDSDPVLILSLLLAILVAILVLSVLIISSNFTFIKDGERRVSKLRKRIVVAFSIGSALPTVIVAVFSTYFFNFGIEAWFDKKISKVLDQSVSVGESYIDEHVLQLKETAISVSDDLTSMYYDLIHSPELFLKVINAQAELRSLDEAIVFQRNSNTILAQTSLSFSLAFMTIPVHLIDRANKGEVVRVDFDPSKIRILIKIKDYDDTYLLIGRLVDTKIIDHIDKTKGAVSEYEKLKDQIVAMQIKFSMVFILLSVVLLLASIIWGRRFAERIVRPIRELVIAAEKVKNGDFSVQVPLEGLKKDEVKVLSSAFNRMVTQIDHQQKDLLIAQRSLAWSDVARRVAHEIKNPLTPIQLSAERLLKKFKDEVGDKDSFEKYANNILRHSNDIGQIVSEFVDFARLPSPNFAKCEIISLINDLVESRKLINDTINYIFFSNVKMHEFICDVSQINRVMVNLMLNSEESFDKTAVKKEIKVTLSVDDEFVKICVEDNGPGFSKKMLKSAKEAYVTTKSNGTGLGLSIVDRIALDHFGTVSLSNNKNNGARVELTMSAISLKNKLK